MTEKYIFDRSIGTLIHRGPYGDVAPKTLRFEASERDISFDVPTLYTPKHIYIDRNSVPEMFYLVLTDGVVQNPTLELYVGESGILHQKTVTEYDFLPSKKTSVLDPTPKKYLAELEFFNSPNKLGLIRRQELSSSRKESDVITLEVGKKKIRLDELL